MSQNTISKYHEHMRTQKDNAFLSGISWLHNAMSNCLIFLMLFQFLNCVMDSQKLHTCNHRPPRFISQSADFRSQGLLVKSQMSIAVSIVSINHDYPSHNSILQIDGPICSSPILHLAGREELRCKNLTPDLHMYRNVFFQPN